MNNEQLKKDILAAIAELGGNPVTSKVYTPSLTKNPGVTVCSDGVYADIRWHPVTSTADELRKVVLGVLYTTLEQIEKMEPF